MGGFFDLERRLDKISEEEVREEQVVPKDSAVQLGLSLFSKRSAEAGGVGWGPVLASTASLAPSLAAIRVCKRLREGQVLEEKLVRHEDLHHAHLPALQGPLLGLPL